MDEHTIRHLIGKYESLNNKTPTTCIKYHYAENGVDVNLYFDAYDRKSLSLSLILTCKDEYNNKRIYYFTTINIRGTSLETKYLPKIQSLILDKITVGNTLDSFYQNMEKFILINNPRVINYSTDTIFTNTLKYQNPDELPFWQHLRKTKMTESTLNKLKARADISINTLRELQKKGFTLVRTADPMKRSELRIILNGSVIDLE